MSWYEFDETAIVTCPCGWTGATEDGVLDIDARRFGWSCPRCRRTLAEFYRPSYAETRRQAEAGNRKAQGELEHGLALDGRLPRDHPDADLIDDLGL